MKLSEHFTLEELVHSDTADKLRINNVPNDAQVKNLTALCNEVLEPARVKFGMPITISSGYRCDRLNKAVGGKQNSQHKLGEAADLQVHPISNLKVLFEILKGLDVDQLLYEKSKTAVWIHVSHKANLNRHYVNDNYQV